ncbi:MAG TPA: septum formation initiator family protein [Gemmatimonadales bacterium]|nr:septum formation initiator family protein [Gemmatimonadales bacterium]
MSRAGWAAVVLLGLMAILAVQGGEYSTGDYFELKRRVAAAESAEAHLSGVVDSLKLVEKAVLTDPREQERIAREEFGMIRPGESLYKVTKPGEP